MKEGHNTRKHLLEKAAIENLLKCNGYTHYSVLKYQDKPDAVLRSHKGELLGIEVVHPCSPEEGELLFGPKTGEMEQSYLDFINEINKEIKRKIKKFPNYSKDYPISLLMRSTNRLIFAREFHFLKQNLVIPENDFKEILILFPKVKTVYLDTCDEDTLPLVSEVNILTEYIYPAEGKGKVYFPSNSTEWTDLIKLY